MLSDSLYLSPYVNTYTFTTNLNRYHNYSASIVSQNNAGLYAAPIYSNGIILNYSPSEPILLIPESNDSTGTRPVFLLYANDNDPDTTLCYSIEISEDSSFSSIIRTFNGKINTSGWNRHRYASYDTAQYTVSSTDSLMLGHTYFWRALTNDSVTSSNISSIKPFTVQYCSGILPDYELAADDSIFLVHITNIITGSERVFINLISPFSGYTEIYIYDIKGSRIKTFMQSSVNKGGYRFTWDLRDDYNHKISTGIYFVYAVSNNNIITKQKFEILK